MYNLNVVNVGEYNDGTNHGNWCFVYRKDEVFLLFLCNYRGL